MERVAKCYAAIGQASDAKRIYAEILEIDPTNAAALREAGELLQVG